MLPWGKKLEIAWQPSVFQNDKKHRKKNSLSRKKSKITIFSPSGLSISRVLKFAGQVSLQFLGKNLDRRKTDRC